MNLFRAKLKTRKQMDATIPAVNHGWWRDVCPGKTLTLRDATQADLDRCYLREGAKTAVADYLCELSDHGALVLRDAVVSLTPIAHASQ